MGVPASEVTHSLLPDVLIMVAVVRIGDALVVDPKLDRPAEFASSPHPPTSAALSGRRLFWARVGWLVIFVLNIGLFSASISAYYDWLINVAGPASGRTLILPPYALTWKQPASQLTRTLDTNSRSVSLQ